MCRVICSSFIRICRPGSIPPRAKVKASIKATLLQHIGEPERRIQSTICLIISKIAHLDWPDQWPELFEHLISCLKMPPSAQHHITGALGVMAEFVRDELADAHVPVIAPMLLPELTRVFALPEYVEACTTHPLTLSMRTMALLLFRDFFELVFMALGDEGSAAGQLMGPYLPTWTGALMDVFRTIPDTRLLAFKAECLQTLVKLMRAFPAAMTSALPDLMALVWPHFTSLAQFYEGCAVQQKELTVPGEEGTPESMQGAIELGLAACFDFFQLAVRKRYKLFAGDSGKSQLRDFLDQVLGMAIPLAKATPDMQEGWVEDLDAFLLDEDADTASFSMRLSVLDLIVALHEVQPKASMAALCRAAQTHLQAVASGASGSDNGLAESCLLMLGRFKDELEEQASHLAKVFALTPLLEQFVLPVALEAPQLVIQSLANSQVSAREWLAARAMWFAATFAASMSPAMVGTLVPKGMSALQGSMRTGLRPIHMSIVQMLRAVGDVTTIAPALSPHGNELLQWIAHGMQTPATGNTEVLVQVLELLDTLLSRMDLASLAGMAGELAELLWAGWKKCGEDVMLSCLLLEVMQRLAKQPGCISGMQERLLPSLVQSLGMTEANDLERLAQRHALTLDMVATLVRYVPSPLPPDYVQHVLPVLLELLSRPDADASVAQNGQQVLCLLVERDAPGILAWHHPVKGGTGLEHILQWLAHLLQEQESESHALFVGPLITQLIRGAGDAMVPVLPQLLGAVSQRLARASNPAFVQSLVLVFAQLLRERQDTVLDFLALCTVVAGEGVPPLSGLTALCRAWCDYYDTFHGFYPMRVSAFVMLQLLASGDARLDAVMVKGDQVDEGRRSASRRIATRSMTKGRPDTWTSIPFPVKVVKLLLQDVLSGSTSLRPARSGPRQPESYAADDDGNDEDEETWEVDVDGDEEEEDYEDDKEAPQRGNTEWNAWEDVANAALQGQRDDDASDDEDAKYAADPVCSMDMSSLLRQTLQSLATGKPGFAEACGALLTAEEQTALRQVLSVGV
jgi:importin-9